MLSLARRGLEELNGRADDGAPRSSPSGVHKRPYRVCHLVATTLGATWMFEQLRELRDRHGYEVSAVINGTEGPLVELLRSENIPFHVNDFGLRGPNRATSLVRSIFELVRLFRAERYDVVQTHIFISLLAVRPAAWIAGVPLRLAMIAGPFHLEARASRMVERLTYWMDTALIPSCQKSVRLCLQAGIPAERLHLIYYSADPGRFAPDVTTPCDLRSDFGWPEDAPVIVLVAYFYPRLGAGDWIPESLHGVAIKGHSDLVEAAALVLERFPKARFALVGGGFAGATGYLEEVKAQVASLGLGDKIGFTGHRTDVSAILRGATVAIQASLCENLGGTLEALAMGTPVVATRVGGMVDVVLDGETGRLAEPRDPRDLALKICDLLDDPAGAREMGDRGRRLVTDRFSIRRTVDDLDALYRQQLGAIPEPRSAYSRPVTALRILGGMPWLACVWTSAMGLDRRRLIALVAQLPRRAWCRLRLHLHPLRCALEPWTNRLWMALVPEVVRRLLPRLRSSGTTGGVR